MKPNSQLMIGALLCMLAVILGAFGAHGLKAMISERMLEVYQTGVHYQMFHSCGILVVGILSLFKEASPLPHSQKLLNASYSFFLLGIIMFCGSLYGLAFSEAFTGEAVRLLGAITPFGGLSFIAGWLCLFLAFRKAN